MGRLYSFQFILLSCYHELRVPKGHKISAILSSMTSCSAMIQLGKYVLVCLVCFFSMCLVWFNHILSFSKFSSRSSKKNPHESPRAVFSRCPTGRNRPRSWNVLMHWRGGGTWGNLAAWRGALRMRQLKVGYVSCFISYITIGFGGYIYI